MGKGKRSSTAQMASGSGRMTFDEFFAKYRSDEGAGSSEYTDIPLDRIQPLRDSGLNARTVFQLWLEDANDYGKAEIVDDAELDRLVDGGATPIYRGMPDSTRSSGKDKLEQVMYADKYYAGEGVFGDGLYFAAGLDVAATYAANTEGKTGSVVRAALKPGYSKINYREARRLIREEHSGKFVSKGDVSSWARSKGYDVIVAETSNGTYYNVINRSALIMSEKLGRARGGANGGTVDF